MDLQCNHSDYAVFLKQLVIFTQRKNLVEIGVAYGGTLFHLCEGAKATGGFVHGFDLWDRHGVWNQWAQMSSKEEVEQKMKNNGCTNFELMRVNTREPIFKQILAEKVKKIDFAFIDGCHSYDGVKNDFLAVKPYLTEDAIVVFHDTEFIDGVREFMIDLRTKYNDGTFDLIDFPYGHQGTICGLGVLMYRKYPRPYKITEICGSPSTPDEIYNKEMDFYNSKNKSVDFSK
jgi:cephalosporin hydroxylase